MQADVVIGLVYGDEAKAKVVNSLCKDGSYTHALRFNGGANAGHTIYLDGQKVITHLVPVGALHGIKSIIGPGCVVNIPAFFKEMDELSKFKKDIHQLVKIAKNTHIVKEEHLQEEISEQKIGTTKRGIGPAYRDKYARVGLRAEDCPELKPYLIDIYEELFIKNDSVTIICEGAQAIGLDIDWGDYPYTTSSHCGIGAVINNGIPHTAIRKVYGVAKCYDTYVGSKKFQNIDDPVLAMFADVGQEFGATTGRKRQTNYLNLDNLKRAANLTSTTDLIINKLDVIQHVGTWKLYYHGELVDMKNEEGFKQIIASALPAINIKYSGTPLAI